jgi:hypothetical protein
LQKSTVAKLFAMFNSISWSQYITAIITLLILYYCFVGFKYFRWEILSLIGVKKVEDKAIAIPAFSKANQPHKTENPEDYLPKSNLEIDISPLVQSFTDEVLAFINGANSNMPKPELLYSLQLIASKYPALKDVDCRDELMQLMFEEVNTKYPELLVSSDLISLWK